MKIFESFSDYYHNINEVFEPNEDGIIVAADKTIKEIVKQEIKRLGNKADLNHIDVSNVTNLSELFKNDRNWNGDISKWDVSNVKYMAATFAFGIFNGDISNWDVSNVKDMNGIFYFNKNFNGDLSKWDVSNVEIMENAFSNSIFNSDISKWDVSNVISMEYMFERSIFNRDISKWDVSKVKYMDRMFENSEFSGNLDKWNIKNVNPAPIFVFAGSPLEKNPPEWYKEY